MLTPRINGGSFLRLVAVGLTLAALSLLGSSSSRSQDAPAPPPCSLPEFSQFDFWLGTWDLRWEGGTGTNTVSKIMDSCVVQEQFEGGGFTGTSLSVYQPATESWSQTWVDNQGGYLDFVGGMEGDRMILSRESPLAEPPSQQRMIFYGITPDSLEWDWEVSTDAGQSWDLKWRIHYQRRP